MGIHPPIPTCKPEICLDKTDCSRVCPEEKERKGKVPDKPVPDRRGQQISLETTAETESGERSRPVEYHQEGN
jgi:hypothetical protein